MKFREIHLEIILRVDLFCYLYSIITSTAFSNCFVSRPGTIKSLEARCGRDSRLQTISCEFQAPEILRKLFSKVHHLGSVCLLFYSALELYIHSQSVICCSRSINSLDKRDFLKRIFWQ